MLDAPPVCGGSCAAASGAAPSAGAAAAGGRPPDPTRPGSANGPRTCRRRRRRADHDPSPRRCRRSCPGLRRSAHRFGTRARAHGMSGTLCGQQLQSTGRKARRALSAPAVIRRVIPAPDYSEIRRGRPRSGKRWRCWREPDCATTAACKIRLKADFRSIGALDSSDQVQSSKTNKKQIQKNTIIGVVVRT